MGTELVLETLYSKELTRLCTREDYIESCCLESFKTYIKEIIKISAKESLGPYEMNQHKPWFDEECSKFLDQRKQAKMQWLQNPNQSNVHNLSNVRREASRHFRNKKNEYLKAKINELETNSKIKNIRDLYRGINDFKKGYHPTYNAVKDVNGDLVADSHSAYLG
jgi:hypothetical protein